MRHQREHERRRIHDQEHDSDGDGDGLDTELGGMGAARVDGGHEHAGEGDCHRGDPCPGGGGRESQLAEAQAAGEERRPEHEQQIADDRPGDRRPHHLQLAVRHEKDPDDELGGVAEGGVEQAADPGPGVDGELLGGVS